MENCATCKFHNVFWGGSGCVLLNGGEHCNYQPTDEEIIQQLKDKLSRYEQAEEEGRLVVLPCKVGDTVFADLRENQKRKPKIEDLAECVVSNIEFDKAWNSPLFTQFGKNLMSAILDKMLLVSSGHLNLGKMCLQKNSTLI